MTWGAIGGAVIGGVAASSAAGSAASGVKAGQEISQARFNQGVGAIQQGSQQGIETLQRGAEFGIGNQQTGAELQIGAAQRAAEQGIQNIQRGTDAQSGQIRQGGALAGERLASGFGQARTDALQGFNQARGDIRGSTAQGVAQFTPFRETGLTAQQRQAALSGTLGKEAFDAAFFESPQQRFAQEQGERARLRNAAATGGVQGGNVLKELTRFGQGNASQFLQQEIANLNTLAGRGFDASTGSATLLGNQADLLGGVGRDQAGTLSALSRDLGIAEADLANLTSDQLAQVIAQRTQGIGQQIDVRGQNIGNIIGTRTANIGNIIGGRTGGIADIQVNRGTNVANLAAGQGSEQALLAGNLGDVNAARTLGINKAVQSGIENFPFQQT